MPDDTLKKKRQTYAQLIAMGLMWSGFVFVLEYLATRDGQPLDYTGQGILFVFAWAMKIGGIVAALVGLWLLIKTYRTTTKQ